jgi:hypothetical protein
VVELNPGSHGARGPARLLDLLERHGFAHVVAEDDIASPRYGATRATAGALAEWELGQLPTGWYANLLCSRSSADLPPVAA